MHTEARPVLAPAATPDDDSTNDVTVEVPRHAPATVPTASAISAPLAFKTPPFESFRLPCSATPSKVPIVSNRSVKRNVKKITKNCPRTASENFPAGPVTIPLKSNAKKCGADGAENGLKLSGIDVTPNGMPIIVVMMIPKRIAPGTLSV